MPVESAADRAAFFNREEFAEAALYTAADSVVAVDCTVIVDRGQGRKAMSLGRSEAAGVDRLIQVLAEGAADDGITPARDGIFDILDPLSGELIELLQVVNVPRLDETGAWWTVEVVQVSG